jgi:hypothetical protein
MAPSASTTICFGWPGRTRRIRTVPSLRSRVKVAELLRVWMSPDGIVTSPAEGDLNTSLPSVILTIVPVSRSPLVKTTSSARTTPPNITRHSKMR